MAQKCKVCQSANLKEINTKLIGGGTASSIAKEFGLENYSIHYHKVHHLPKLLVAGFERKQTKTNGELVKRANEIEETKIQDSFDVMGKIDFLLKETEDIYAEVRGKGQNLLALKSLDSLRNTYQLLINISAQMHANRIAELELLKQQKEMGIDTEKLEFRDNLKILSFEELQMLQRLTNKVHEQSDELLILDGKVFGWDAPLKFK